MYPKNSALWAAVGHPVRVVLVFLAVAAMLLLGTQAPAAAEAAASANAAAGAAGPGPNRPFGQHTVYADGTLLPSFSQASMDDDVAALYDDWRDNFLTQNPYETDQYYVYYNGAGEAGSETPDAVTTSESNGYGMLISALMAGHDPDARVYFDGLLRFGLAHPSSIDSALMAWQQRDTGTAIESTTTLDPDDGQYYGDDAATDGDLDMAYALLLASEQWGDDGEFDYLQHAKNIMAGILRSEVNPTQHTLLLGDWALGDAHYGGGTRPSDFMTQHLKDFAAVTGEAEWDAVVAATYALSKQMIADYSPNAGLLPDFVVPGASGYQPADETFLESDTDGMYSWNSSRTPWRLGTDYLVTGDDTLAGEFATLNTWIQQASGGDPSAIMQGYHLDGTTTETDSDLAFVAPFTVAAMLDGSNQQWLDTLWRYNADTPATTYFGDSIRVLSMIVASGNWWSPSGLSADNAAVDPGGDTTGGTDAVSAAPTSDELAETGVDADSVAATVAAALAASLLALGGAALMLRRARRA